MAEKKYIQLKRKNKEEIKENALKRIRGTNKLDFEFIRK